MLQHDHHRVPVTALAFYNGNILLAGEGSYLRAYDVDSKIAIGSLKVFEDGRVIHGIVPGRSDAGFVTVYGGHDIRIVWIVDIDTSRVTWDLGSLFRLKDWILDAAWSPGDDALLAFVTAHNALVVLSTNDLLLADDTTKSIPIEDLVPGSNCILYSAHVTWIDQTTCVVASGTAFGDVILWSSQVPRSDESKLLSAQSTTHYTFSAHDGSVFGVRISEHLSDTGLDGCKRVLATCSDDRTIRIWDISDLSRVNVTLFDVQRDTGFGNRLADDQSAPNRLAMSMGHVSRIWHVRFLSTPLEQMSGGNGPLRVASFGEDATNIYWSLSSSIDHNRRATTYRLEQILSQTAHSGKHIWSVAQDEEGRIATGGADGAIAIRSAQVKIPAPQEVSQVDAQDTYKSYTFVDEDTLISTTNKGRILSVKIDSDDDVTNMTKAAQLAEPKDGLKGYSIVTGVPGYAFIGGTDGQVYMYVHAVQALTEAIRLSGKVAGLFAHDVSSDDDSGGVVLLATKVGHDRGEIVYLNVDLNTQGQIMVISRHRQICLPDNMIVTSFTHMQRHGRNLAVLGTRDGMLRVYDVTDDPVELAALSEQYRQAQDGDVVDVENHEHSPSSSTSGSSSLTGNTTEDDVSSVDDFLRQEVEALGIEQENEEEELDDEETSIQSTTSEDTEPPPPPDHGIWPNSKYPQLHGKEAVTAVKCIANEDGSEWFVHSVGRDGTHVICRFHFAELIHLERVHQLALPFGPNIEGISLLGDQVRIWGFRGTRFVVHDLSEARDVMTVTCGGAHRSWTYSGQANGGMFVWTKASKLYQQAQSKLPFTVIAGGRHGREIKATAALSFPEHQIVATGSEDTDIKLHVGSDEHGFKCAQTLRKHNTGIQHLMLDHEHLYSSGGFEEFYIWRLQRNVPGVGLAVQCESRHPRSGQSDLRIMSFYVGHVQDEDGFISHTLMDMVYSDSMMKRWKYSAGDWELVTQGDYLTSCLTHVAPLYGTGKLLTAATDGHLASWPMGDVSSSDALRYDQRHKVHQSAILSVASAPPTEDSTLVFTGGDDNAIGITRWPTGHGQPAIEEQLEQLALSPQQSTLPKTLLIPRAHAAAITGLLVWRGTPTRYILMSTGLDQKVNLWAVDVNDSSPGVNGVEVQLLQSVRTNVADASGLSFVRLGGEDNAVGVLVTGVGMEGWRLG